MSVPHGRARPVTTLVTRENLDHCPRTPRAIPGHPTPALRPPGWLVIESEKVELGKRTLHLLRGSLVYQRAKGQEYTRTRRNGAAVATVEVGAQPLGSPALRGRPRWLPTPGRDVTGPGNLVSLPPAS